MSHEDAISEYKKILMPGFATLTPHDKSKKLIHKIIKEIMKWTKIAIYLFLFSMGLYGCFQTYSDYWTMSSTTIGNGLEFGFNYGTTGDVQFDLQYGGTGPYYPYSDWSLDYGPFYAFFVWPFAQLLLEFMYATRSWPVGLNALVGIVLVLLIIRVITMAISARSMLQTEKMTEIQGKMAEVNAKYKGAKDMQSKQKKQVEIQALYKKHNVKPFAAFEQIFVTLPIFLVIYRVITTLRPLKMVSLFGIWDLSLSPLTEIFSHFTDSGYLYIFFLLLVIPAQFLSQRVPQMLARQRGKNASTVGKKNNDQLKKTKMMQTVMTVFMAIIAAVSASGIGLYWFFNALLSMLQSYIMHQVIMRRRQAKSTESKLAKLTGID